MNEGDFQDHRVRHQDPPVDAQGHRHLVSNRLETVGDFLHLGVRAAWTCRTAGITHEFGIVESVGLLEPVQEFLA
jgi:hypothetical protein